MANHTIINLSSTEGGEIDRDRIVDKDLVSEDCFCPICQYLLWKPQSCSTCHHNFCEKCLHTWLENPTSQNKCPFRCQPFQSCPCSPDIQSALSQLNVRCRNAPFGCSQILPYDQLEQHENVQCQYLSKRCSECEQLVLLSKYDEHRQNEELCRPHPIKCTICQNYFEKSVMHGHFIECCTKKTDQIMAGTFQNPNMPFGNLNQTLQSNEFINSFLRNMYMIKLLQEQTQLSRLPTSLKGVDAVRRAREQNCGHFYHILIMLKFILLNWRKMPFFIINIYSAGAFLVLFVLLGFYAVFCRWSYSNIYFGHLSMIIFSCLITLGLSFICQWFTDQTMIVFWILTIFLLGCTLRSSLEAYEMDPNFNRNFYCVILCCLLVPRLKISLLLIRFYYWLVPLPVAVILSICVNMFLAWRIYCAFMTIIPPTPINHPMMTV